MKFIQSIAKPEPADLAEIDGNPDLPFVKFLASKRLSEHLINYILYSIAMVSADQNNEESGAGLITTYQGMEAMARFLKSLGRYGNTPWIYPLYGTGEVVQAFARFAAVYGATYMLTTSAKSIVVDVETKKEFRGIVSTASNQIISAKYLISNPDHVPELIKPTSSRFECLANLFFFVLAHSLNQPTDLPLVLWLSPILPLIKLPMMPFWLLWRLLVVLLPTSTQSSSFSLTQLCLPALKANVRECFFS
jgi:hypothetical protein